MPKIASPTPPKVTPGERAPGGAAGEEAPAIDRESPSVELRLAIGKDGLGIELGRPARVACIDVTEIAVVISGVRFPLDVSGGVSRFRHRRGELKRLAIEARARSIEAWAAPKLRGLVSTETPDVWIAVRRDAATIAIASRDGEAALAFDVTIDTHDEDVRLTVTNARGLGLKAPATALAIGAVRATLKDAATREGSRFTIAKAVTRLGRVVLPEAGARAPSVSGVRWSVTTAASDAWILHANDGLQAEAIDEAARAREEANVAKDGDDARVAGDFARARALDLAMLERAPRHPGITARIAEIDLHAGGRAEAALAMLDEADADPGPRRGVLRAALLAESGDLRAAVAAFARVGDTEPAPAVAARAYERAAALEGDPHDALTWLDLAVARAPGVARIRWARVARRLAAGRIEDAVADVEHVEAMASGARAKHAAWRRAGEIWRAAGLVGESATLFERALRYLPEDPEAIAGLGAALVDERRAARGAALLSRAIELAEARGDDASEMTLDLARALAEGLGDRPAAIARVRSIPNVASCALVARGLEARWRAALGDHAGASLAWAKVRDLASARFDGADPRDAEEAARLLREAAGFERDVRDDLASAQRHLASALRLRPHDGDLGKAYRDVCAKLAPPIEPTTQTSMQTLPQTQTRMQTLPQTQSPTHSQSPTQSQTPTRTASLSLDTPDADDPALAARVEELTRVLQSDPTRDDVVDELAELLIQLGRSLELLALLTARLEDAPPERRAELLPAQRAVLQRLEEQARAAGSESEASLFRDARQMLE